MSYWHESEVCEDSKPPNGGWGCLLLVIIVYLVFYVACSIYE